MTRKVGICFFGITRSLRHTFPSIEQNVLTPARKLSTPKLYAHFFDQEQIANPRTGEHGTLDKTEHELLAPDWLALEEPGGCLARWNFDQIKAHGDPWDNDFASMRNLIHQLHSLHTVTGAALKDGVDVCLFIRPDLHYHDSLKPVLRKAIKAAENTVFLPGWQAFDGYNDRFAICVGKTAIEAYGKRAEKALEMCRALGKPLHSESLVRFSLDQDRIAIQRIPTRASRVRAGGEEVGEHFAYPRQSKLWYRLAAFAERIGMKPTIRMMLLMHPRNRRNRVPRTDQRDGSNRS